MHRVWRFIIVVCLLLVTACGSGEAATSTGDAIIDQSGHGEIKLGTVGGKVLRK